VPIRYHPEPGDVFFCQFPQPGAQPFAPPEMTKHRRVVVLSPRFRRHLPSTIVVVPLSTSAPRFIEPFHYQLLDSYSFLSASAPIWVKANMLAHVSLARLFPVYRHRQIANAALTARDLQGVRAMVSLALGLNGSAAT
jgi:uncharacterized protein YifN (PemK superfamily)